MTKKELLLENLKLRDRIEELENKTPICKSEVIKLIQSELKLLSINCENKGYEYIGLYINLSHDGDYISGVDV